MSSSARQGFRAAGLLVVLALSLMFSGPTGAAGIRADPFSFDPDRKGCGTGAWVAGEGLPDAGNANHALLLTKDCPTATFASGGATIAGVEGMVLTELGFSYRDDGWCGAGAPRFNLTTTAGFYFIGGCANGVHTSLDNGWTKVTFSGIPAEEVVRFSIVFDEGTDTGPGLVYLDDININGTLIGKPGNA